MDKTLRTSFHLSLTNLARMRSVSARIAVDLGFKSKGEIDAFQHAYTSAKLMQSYGEGFANLAGHAHEWLREVLERTLSLGRKGNPPGEWEMDIYNNEIGRYIQKGLALKQMPSHLHEHALRQKIAVAIRQGELQTFPTA